MMVMRIIRAFPVTRPLGKSKHEAANRRKLVRRGRGEACVRISEYGLSRPGEM